MNDWLKFLLPIVIGSAIGGITNELAIRMLFRPYKTWKIAGFRVPFTPGLIPRRRDEIGIEMGRLVERHLLTPEGIKEAITQMGVDGVLRRWLTSVLDRLLTDQQPLREKLQMWLPTVLTPEGGWSESVREPVNRVWHTWLDRVITQYGERSLESLLSSEEKARLEALIQSLGKTMIARLNQYLGSLEGKHEVQNMVRELFAGGRGMFGGLVGMFLGDDKIVSKVLPYLEELLESPRLTARVSSLLQQEADKLLQKPLHEYVEWLGEEQLAKWKEEVFVKLEGESLASLDKPLGYWLDRFRQPVVDKGIPLLASLAVGVLEKNVDRIIANLSIRDIVTRQVEGFPLERIEEMILGISGREFRMITILGFILGGLIGVVQGLLNVLW